MLMLKAQKYSVRTQTMSQIHAAIRATPRPKVPNRSQYTTKHALVMALLRSLQTTFSENKGRGSGFSAQRSASGA